MVKRLAVFVDIAIFSVLVILAITSPGPLYGQPHSATWQAGVARVDITPRDSLWMAGYGARDHPGEGTLHPLWAKALVLQDAEEHRGVIVTTDLLGFPGEMSDRIRVRVEKRHHLARAQIILNSSHTHSGPVLRSALYDIYPLDTTQIRKIEAYSSHLEDQVVALVDSAFSHLQPAVLSAGNGTVRFQVNRRNNESGTLPASTELNGPNDYAVPVLKVVKPGGGLLAVLFGYACHATVLNGYEWSGDYPGFAQIALERDHPGVTALFFQGCGADQNPLPRRTVALAQQYGRELAAAVDRVLAELTEAGTPLTADLTTAYREIPLAFTSPPSDERLQAYAERTTGYQHRWAERVLRERGQGREAPVSYPYPVQVWRIGGQPLVALGGEVVVDYAVELKRILGQEIFVMGYSNDVMSYIPSVRVLREGGYEGAESQIVYGLQSTWSADIQNRIISTVLRLADEAGVTLPESPLLEN